MRESQIGQSIHLTRQVINNGSADGVTYSMNYLPGVAWLLWACGGLFGLHRLYLGELGCPVLMALTLGGAGIWWIIDAFLLPAKTHELNSRRYATGFQTSI